MTTKAVEAQEAGKTNRALVVWPSVERMFCALCGAVAAIGVAVNLGGRVTTVNGSLTVAVSIAIPAGALKILKDGQQKRQQRARLEELEAENRMLHQQVGRLEVAGPGPEPGPTRRQKR